MGSWGLRSNNRCGGQRAWNGSLTLRWNSACPTEAGPQSGSKTQKTSKLVQTMTILCFCLEDIKYLKYNPTPVINRWKEDIEQQCTMASCIHLIKMKVVPKFLYCFQNIPTFHSKETIWNNWLIFRFMWNGQQLLVNRCFLESEGGRSSVGQVTWAERSIALSSIQVVNRVFTSN